MADSLADFLIAGVAPGITDVFTPLGYTPHAKQEIFHEMSRQKIGAILFGGAAGGGKLNRCSELVPTPAGFIKLADIRPGDNVFGLDGLVYPVLAQSDVEFEESWLLTFSDGSTVTAHDEHLWLTYDEKELAALTRRGSEWQARRRANRASRAKANPEKGRHQASVTARRNSEREHEYLPMPTGTVRTTAEIVATLKCKSGRNNHAVPVCAPLEMPEADLPLDPYVLGCWLGDGSTHAGVVTGMDDEIHDAIESAGFAMQSVSGPEGNRAVNVRYEGLRDALREIGVFGNKHIPHEYLWASKSQRLALLQGLMDTDGCINVNGSAEFCNTNQGLAEGVAHLARSLGHKVTVREGRATLYGKDCGPKWTCKFTPKMEVVRLPRKVARLRLAENRRTTNFRYIVSAERTEAAPMKCLRVGSPDNLFLITENFIPTHNSCALLMEAIHNAVNFPNMRIACIRRTYNELNESFLAELRKRGYARVLGAKWNQTNYILRFPNGSEINFTYAENEIDASRLLGGEYQLFCIDEAGLMPAVVIQHIEERLRSGSRGLPVIGLRLSTNPGGPSHKYLKDRFITPTKYGQEIVLDNDDRTVAFIQSKYTDNPYVDKGYEKILNSIPDANRRAAMRDGDWDAMLGAFFSSFQRIKHVIPAFDVPMEWQRYCGIDYGFRDPFAAEWGAVDNDGRVYMYREIYATEVPANVQGQLILEAEQAAGEHDVVRVADPSMWGARGTPLTIADEYGMIGCGIAKADNDRLNGWSRFHYYLADAPACEYHRQFGLEECPLIHFFEDRVPNLIEAIPNLPRSKTKPDDAETRLVDDHGIDATRYLLMMAGNNARPVIYNDTPSNTAQRAHQEEANRAYAAPSYQNQLVEGRYGGSLGRRL